MTILTYKQLVRRKYSTLQWRHSGRNDVTNRRRLDCYLNRLFRRKSKKTSKLRVNGLCEGNSPVTSKFPAQRASNAVNVYIWWRHHAYFYTLRINDASVKPDIVVRLWLLTCSKQNHLVNQCWFILNSHRMEGKDGIGRWRAFGYVNWLSVILFITRCLYH